MSDQLQHSAKGTTWSKKNHKYLRKEGNKYVYAEDSSLSEKAKGAAKEAAKSYLTNYVADHMPLQARRYYNAGKQVNALYQASKKGADIVEQSNKRVKLKRKLDTIERLNNMEKEKKQAAERKIADASRAQRKELQQKALLKERNEKHQQELLQQARNNRLNSNVKRGRTARDILSEKGTTRVIYADGKDGNGNSVRAKRVISKRPTYDDRGFKTGDVTVEDSYTQKGTRHPGGTARDMISRKGTQRVEYEESADKKKAIRKVTNRDYSKSIQLVDKWRMQTDRRNIFKKTVDNVKRKADYGKRKVESLFKKDKKKSNQPKIPLEMRMIRGWKKLTKKKSK